MKKQIVYLLVLLLVLGFSFPLLAQQIPVGETVVLYLKGYIPPSTSITFSGQELIISSSADDFTYSVTEYGEIQLLNVVAR
ncbi:MAG TPA: hypothetical protein VFC80_00625 [Sphaerochaeta sp.]|nr:hypothetical protein [Sphaerochaeta sp.]